jgi:hypothetical protein
MFNARNLLILRFQLFFFVVGRNVFEDDWFASKAEAILLPDSSMLLVEEANTSKVLQVSVAPSPRREDQRALKITLQPLMKHSSNRLGESSQGSKQIFHVSDFLLLITGKSELRGI